MLQCLSNEFAHSDSSFRDRPEIIQKGPKHYATGPDGSFDGFHNGLLSGYKQKVLCVGG